MEANMYQDDIFQFDAWELNPNLHVRESDADFAKRLTPMTWVVVGLGNPVSLESREMCVHINEAGDEIKCRRELGNNQHEIRTYSFWEGAWYEREGSCLIEIRHLRKVFDQA